MILKQFKENIENQNANTMLRFGISKPFSWRGSYEEVAFSIEESPMMREEILIRIYMAYTGMFTGYKGGEYRYGDYTNVNFEQGPSTYTDGGYAAEMIAKLEGGEPYYSQEHRLMRLLSSSIPEQTPTTPATPNP